MRKPICAYSFVLPPKFEFQISVQNLRSFYKYYPTEYHFKVLEL